MITALRPTAPSISAFLRRNGLRPVPTRDREGVHVSGSTASLGHVHISMQWESARINARMAQDVADLLREAGYHVAVTTLDHVVVSR